MCGWRIPTLLIQVLVRRRKRHRRRTREQENVCVHVCVCVRERESERERGRGARKHVHGAGGGPREAQVYGVFRCMISSLDLIDGRGPGFPRPKNLGLFLDGRGPGFPRLWQGGQSGVYRRRTALNCALIARPAPPHVSAPPP